MLNQLSHPGAPNIYLFLRQGEREWRRDRERGEQRIRSGLYADSSEPGAGLELKNCETVT